MITLNKHTISASIKQRYANTTYSFDFINNKQHSAELKFDITIDPKAFISKFEACIDGELFIGKTKKKETAEKEYTAAKQKKENAILISQPNKNIPNLFQIKTNIDAKSKVLLTIQIEQYLQKTFGYNELNIQVLRNLNKYNISQNFDHITFQLTIEDNSGIYDINIPITNNDDIAIDQQIINKSGTKCEIMGKIMDVHLSKNEVNISNKWRETLKVNDKIDANDRKRWYNAEIIDKSCDKGIKIHYLGFGAKYDEYIDINSDRLAPFNSHSTQIRSNELIFKYKIKGESGESHVLFDNNSNTFCHIISMNDCGQNNNIARRVMFVIDRSGSMGGSKWLKTISATIMAIKQLRNGYDRFGIILFDNKTELLPYKDSRGCVLADNKSISDSIDSLQNKNVDGGTNINDALLKAIELIKIDILLLNNDSNNPYNFFMNQIIFITDGEANDGERDSNKIVTNIQNANDLSKIDKYNNKISIFSFGVGKDGNDSGWINDLNHSFLKLLSINNNGFYQRIKKSSADTSLFQYFDILSKPVLSNINIEYKNKNIKDLTNTKFNTLYCGNDLIICGKIEEKEIKDYNLLLSITQITGKEITQNNTSVTKPITISKEMKININTNDINNNDNIQRIWAYLKLQQLATKQLIHRDMIEMDDDEKKEDSSIPLSLALEYRFITPWTSMIVVKKKDNAKVAEQTQQLSVSQQRRVIQRSALTHNIRRKCSTMSMAMPLMRLRCAMNFGGDDDSSGSDDDDNNDEAHLRMVFDSNKGDGLEMNVAFERKHGTAVMVIKANNMRNQDITRIDIKFNKNYLGIQPTQTVPLNGNIAPNGSQTVNLPLHLSQDPTLLKKPLDLTVQMAVRSVRKNMDKSRVTMFATPIPAEIFFDNNDNNTLRDADLFLKEWKSIPNTEHQSQTLKECKNTDIKLIKDIFVLHRYCFIIDRQIPNRGVSLYFCTTLRSVAILLEVSIAINGECRVLVKSKNKYLSYVACETAIKLINTK